MQRRSLFVTEPAMPPLEEFVPYLAEIWRRKWLTNNGHFHEEFEVALAEYLGVPFLSLFNNGTTALLAALRVLRLQGEVITTPFSFVATSHAILWAGLTPVFADIDLGTFGLSPASASQMVGPKTAAILPVHCFGTPADLNGLSTLAAESSLPLVYDAAHAFGVKVGSKSLCDFGDLAVLSFHATKVFTTFEGGAIISHDPLIKAAIDQVKNFGITNEVTVESVGINGKMTEFQAAFGLLQLKYVDGLLERRRSIAASYAKLLGNIPGITLLAEVPGVVGNGSYYPILVGSGYSLSRDELYRHLRSRGIIARRYFFPLISEFPMYRGFQGADPERLPVAMRVASEVICLPLFPGLSDDDVQYVAEAIIA